MASPWKQEFKDFKPHPPPWLSTGRKATPGVDYYDPRKPYKYWIEKEIRNNDEELQKVINMKLTDDVKNRRTEAVLSLEVSHGGARFIDANHNQLWHYSADSFSRCLLFTNVCSTRSGR